MLNNRRTKTATGNAAIAETIAPAEAFQLVGILIKLSAAGGAGNLTITVDAAAGAAYDTVLLTQDMTAVVNYVNMLDVPIQLQPGDEIDIAWANGNSRAYGMTVIYDVL